MKRTAYILGAGFSHYAGLPLQADFTKELLAARDFGSGPSRALVRYLDEFVNRVFDRSKNARRSIGRNWRIFLPVLIWPLIPVITSGARIPRQSSERSGEC
jgi:hypothetical protein